MRALGSISWVALLFLAGNQPLRGDDQAEARAVVDRAIQAHGGEKNLTRFKAVAMKFKGKVYFNDNPLDYTGEMTVQFPDQQKLSVSVEVMGNSITMVRVLDKNKGWVKQENQTKAMSKEELAEEKEQLYLRSLSHMVTLVDKGFELSPVGEVMIGKHEAVGIKVSHKGHRDVNMYFDKKAGVLLKNESNVKSLATGAEVSQEIFYQDHKKADGLMRPGKIKIKQDGKGFLDIDEITDVKLEEKLDDSEFAKP